MSIAEPSSRAPSHQPVPGPTDALDALDEDAALTVDQVSDHPPDTLDAHEDETSDGEGDEDSLTVDQVSDHPPDTDDLGLASGESCDADEGPQLAVTGRIPVALEAPAPHAIARASRPGARATPAPSRATPAPPATSPVPPRTAATKTTPLPARALSASAASAASAASGRGTPAPSAEPSIPPPPAALLAVHALPVPPPRTLTPPPVPARTTTPLPARAEARPQAASLDEGRAQASSALDEASAPRAASLDASRWPATSSLDAADEAGIEPEPEEIEPEIEPEGGERLDAGYDEELDGGSGPAARGVKGRRAFDPLLLDPGQALGVPRRPPGARPRRPLPPRTMALFGGLFGLALIATMLTLVIRLDPGHGSGPAGSASAKKASPGGDAPAAASPSGATSGAGVASGSAAPRADGPPEPGVWRVANLASEEGVRMISGKMGSRSLMEALEEEHVPRPQIFRILKAFDDAKVFDKPKKSHQYSVALDRASKRVRGFEYLSSASEVWQAREGEDGKLSGTKLDLKVEQRRIAKTITIKEDLKSAVLEVGLDDDMIALLDEALGERMSLGRFGKGSTLRVVAQEQLVGGRFARYLTLEAVEYTLPQSEKHPRIYHYRGKVSGYFDQNGKAPMRSSWSAPLKAPRVTSRYNPKRMHPVLHTVMPHNGVDFGAATGTPVYAVAPGSVEHVGPHGPSGNLILVNHGNGMVSGYAHLSKFAPGLHPGDKVESHQFIGNVGTTGRSTGPHLHFSLKKNGAFVDPLTVLKLNEERVLPKDEREAFETFKKEIDQALGGAPAPGESAGDGEGEDTPKEEHGEEDDTTPSPAGSGSAQPCASDSALLPAPGAPAQAPPVTDETSADSAVWKPL